MDVVWSTSIIKFLKEIKSEYRCDQMDVVLFRIRQKKRIAERTDSTNLMRHSSTRTDRFGVKCTRSISRPPSDGDACVPWPRVLQTPCRGLCRPHRHGGAPLPAPPPDWFHHVIGWTVLITPSCRWDHPPTYQITLGYSPRNKNTLMRGCHHHWQVGSTYWQALHERGVYVIATRQKKSSSVFFFLWVAPAARRTWRHEHDGVGGPRNRTDPTVFAVRPHSRLIHPPIHPCAASDLCAVQVRERGGAAAQRVSHCCPARHVVQLPPSTWRADTGGGRVSFSRFLFFFPPFSGA